MGSASKVTAKRSVEPETEHQVLPFRPRNAGAQVRRGPRRSVRRAAQEPGLGAVRTKQLRTDRSEDAGALIPAYGINLIAHQGIKQ